MSKALARGGRAMCCAIAIAAAYLVPSAQGVILYATGDPNVNTTAPGDELTGSGWQYEGDFGHFLGTAIAPQFFITARHVAHAGGVFTFNGANYSLAKLFEDPQSDLAIWKINGVLPLFAPLYSRSDEPGKRLVVIGRGKERGAEMYRDGALRGWSWSAGDTHIRRWGENIVSGAFTNSNPSDPLIFARFDQDGIPNEAHLAAGDSGGAVFMQDGPTWKLAGINFAVDPLWSEPSEAQSAKFSAAIFDARGYYDRVGPGNFVLITSANPVPTSFYATRISAKLDWIYSVIEPTADRDGDGIPNLLEYAFRLNPEAPDVSGLPQFSLVDGVATLIYRRVTTASDIQYAIEKSADLVSWEPANAQQEGIALEANVETMRATVPATGDRLFLRVVITRP